MQDGHANQAADPFTKTRKPRHKHRTQQTQAGKRLSPIHDEQADESTRSETNMGKVLVVILATMAALWIAFLVVGPQIGNTAFNMPHFHTAVPWMAVLGACVGYGFYRIVKGK